MKFLKHEQTLLRLLANSINDNEYMCVDEIDADVLNEAIKQGVTVLAFEGAKNSHMPADISKRWNNQVSGDMRKNIQLHTYHNYLNASLDKMEINYCVLKGCSSAWYYKNPIFRNMGDIDFFVRKEDMPKVVEFFSKEGFKEIGKGHSFHHSVKKGGMRFEAHYGLAGMPNGAVGEKIGKYISDLIEKSTLEKNITGEFKKPSDFHHGLIIILHTYHHIVSGGIGLRHLADFAAFINHFSNSEFCDMFESKLKAVGLWKFTAVLGRTSAKYLNVPHKEWMNCADENVCDRLILDILKGGNFGTKDTKRSKEGLFLNKNGADGKSGVFAFVENMNKEATSQFNVLKKYKALRPFGWIFIGTRYTYNVLFKGRDKIKIKESIDGASKRYDIYKEFNVFKEEK